MNTEQNLREGLGTNPSVVLSSSGGSTYLKGNDMGDDQVLRIAEAFSPFPAGRVPEDGNYNGEAFRKEYLVPSLRRAASEGVKLIVSLDGLKSCGSSFLESAFGGLVRYDGFSKAQLQETLKIEFTRSSLERYKIAIDRYIQKAQPEN